MTTNDSSLRFLLKSAKTRLESLSKGHGSRSVDYSSFWTPNPGPQRVFIESTCREILYGGAAGGGKSAAITALPLIWAHLSGFKSLTLRRTSTQLKDLLSKAGELYSSVFPGRRIVNKGGRATFTTPVGAEFMWGHCKNSNDHAQFDGWELNLLMFDELTHFTREQYLKICARVRSANPELPTLIRATTNPGGEGHEWVFKHWGAWLDPEFEAEGLPKKSEREPGTPPAKPCEVWWIRTNEDGTETYFASDPGASSGKNQALSRTFIPAKLSDNPILEKNDPSYFAQLNKLDPVRRAQLRDGNWLIKPAAGLYFKRKWCLFVERNDIPLDAIYVRFWDRAGTEKTEHNDPDFTVGLLMARSGSTYWIVDRVKGQWSPGKVEAVIRETTERDAAEFKGAVTQVVAQDPGQAGKDQATRTVQNLSGFSVGVQRESGSKLVRFWPFSSQAEHGNVRICKGAWNDDYCSQLEEFDGQERQKDDDADGTSGAFNRLSNSPLGGDIVKISSYRGATINDFDDEGD